MRIITLTTDFGHNEYVAQMKGVIYGIAPDARIVDISHDITPQCINEGAFVLWSTVNHFKNAVHVAVVDPGVGGHRKPVVFDCERGTLVGPDNGLLEPASRVLGFKACYEIAEAGDNTGRSKTSISSTFHGRDIFAPVAARLAQGLAPDMVGPRWKDFVINDDIIVDKLGSREAAGKVMRVDRFGNIITNLPAMGFGAEELIGKRVLVTFRRKKHFARVVRTYSEGTPCELLLLASSNGFMELCVRDRSAASILGAVHGDRLRIEQHPVGKTSWGDGNGDILSSEE